MSNSIAPREYCLNINFRLLELLLRKSGEVNNSYRFTVLGIRAHLWFRIFKTPDLLEFGRSSRAGIGLIVDGKLGKFADLD